MTAVMVRYKTHPEHQARNAELVRAVFGQLRDRSPRGFQYTCFQAEDGVTFVHLASMASPDDNPLPALPAFQAFQEALAQRCVEPPAFTALSTLESFGSQP